MHVYKNLYRTMLLICIILPLLFLAGAAGFTMEEADMEPDPSGSRDMAPGATDEEVDELVAGNSEFAFELYREIGGQIDGNFLFSPYSISLALAMTYAGARGETEVQMADAMHFMMPQGRLHPAFNLLDLVLASRGEPNEWMETEGFKLNIANSIWGQQGYEFLPEFIELLASNYGAGLRLADFIGAPDAARIRINQWVEDRTEERIKDLLAPGVIDALTRLVLVNAIYFNAAWAYPFEEDDTEDDYFYPPDSDGVLVPMMFQIERFRYTIAGEFKAITLPYDGFELGMTIILPEDGCFDGVEASLDADFIDDLLVGLSSHEIILTMPKFEYESSFSLPQTLSNMGMPVAFTSNADFSGMDGTRNLFISDVIHKAFIKADEAGTEAAAATAVVMTLAAERDNEPAPIEFKIDRPFIFFIWDYRTKAILFVGRVLNPEA